MDDPVGWPMAAFCQLPDLAFFLLILCYSRSQYLWDLLVPSVSALTPFLFYHYLTNTAVERVREGCSSGPKPLGCLSSAFSRPGKSFHHQPNQGELHHTFAAAG
jgi:hypothetical protein